MSAADLRIRAGTPQDVPLILEFIQALAAYEKLSHEVIATVSDLERSLFGERPHAECLIAEASGRPVGFALFFHNFSTFLGKRGLFVEDLFVYPEHRGRGYGTALLTHLARLALERDCGRMEWSVLNWNEASIRFYESLGAVPMNEWVTYRLTGDALARLGSDSRVDEDGEVGG